jgi:hypothetical protein
MGSVDQSGSVLVRYDLALQGKHRHSDQSGLWDAADVRTPYIYTMAFDASGGVTHWVTGFGAGEWALFSR